jgi:hypothetical protein
MPTPIFIFGAYYEASANFAAMHSPKNFCPKAEIGQKKLPKQQRYIFTLIGR